MAIELVELSKNTRGVNSRKITYKAIGKWVTKLVDRESKPVLNPDGTKKLDEDGNEVRESLGKDSDGKLITIKEEVPEFVTEGVLTEMEDALSLVNNDEQVLLDCFAEGFNERQYSIEAGKDELDEFLIDLEMDKDQKAAFKKTARQISRNYELSLIEAAEQVKSLMVRAQAKRAAKAEAVPA
jgi:hypothetical protein